MIRTRIIKQEKKELFCDLCEEEIPGGPWWQDQLGNMVTDITKASQFHSSCLFLARNIEKLDRIKKNYSKYKE